MAYHNFSLMCSAQYAQLSLTCFHFQLQQDVEGNDDFPLHAGATYRSYFCDGRWSQLQLLSVLKGDHGVHFVHMKRAVPENSGEVVCVWRVVQLDLLAESSMLGERINLSFIINNLNGRRQD